MKKSIVIIVCFLCLRSFAQQLEVVYYENKIVKDTTEINALPAFIRKSLEPNLFAYTLTYGNGYSLYENNDFSKLLNVVEMPMKSKVENEQENEEGNQTIFISTPPSGLELYKTYELKFFKDYLNKKIYAELYTSGKKQVIDSFFDWNWEITEDEKVISGYVCKKAISRMQGYHFEAWFTDEIPVSAGPEKFDGLPGLILYVNTGAVEFVAKSIRFLEQAVVIPPPVFKDRVYTFKEVYTKIETKTRMFESKTIRNPKTNLIEQTHHY